MSNSNQTPPAWAIEAADHLHAMDSVVRNRETLRENAAIIAARSPDAEALAEALEDGLQLFDGPRESTHDWYTGRIEIRKRMVEALAAHRAAHPKVSA